MIPQAIIATILDKIFGLIDKTVKDKDLAQEIKQAAQKDLNSEQMQQIALQIAQAQSPHLFVAGARPFGQWCVNLGMGLLILVLVAINIVMTYKLSINAPIDNFEKGIDVITQTILWLAPLFLGINGLRTYEKYKGIAREAWPRKLNLTPLKPPMRPQ